jgi:hypothetical protein
MQEFCVRFADFSIGAVARDPLLQFALGASRAKFACLPGLGCGLGFEVVVEERPPFLAEELLFESPTGYAVGLSAGGQLLIRGWASSLPACVAQVEPEFRSGVVFVPPARVDAHTPFYPLETIDMVVAIHRFAALGGLVVHGAGISDGQQGYLFTGPSGAGKSTIAELWSFVPDALVLGEDTSLVVWQDGRPMVYGTPWHQDPARCSPGGFPLAGVFVLAHGQQNRAVPCGRAEGAAALLANCLLPTYRRAAMQGILEGVNRLSGCVPVRRLAFRPDRDVVEYVRMAGSR